MATTRTVDEKAAIATWMFHVKQASCGADVLTRLESDRPEDEHVIDEIEGKGSLRAQALNAIGGGPPCPLYSG